MTSTRTSLLRRLEDWDDVDAWSDFERRYGELVLRYALRAGLQLVDAEDLRQRVLFDMSKALRGFRYDKKRGRFRDYLGRATKNAIARHFRRHEGGDESLDEEEAVLEAPDDLWTSEWVSYHYREAMRAVAETHDARSLEIFRGLLDGGSTNDVAARFDTSEATVRKVKQRLKSRLREIIARQIAEEDDLVE